MGERPSRWNNSRPVKIETSAWVLEQLQAGYVKAGDAVRHRDRRLLVLDPDDRSGAAVFKGLRARKTLRIRSGRHYVDECA